MAASRAKCIMTAVLLMAAAPLPVATRAARSLDYDFFKTRVQPIFLQKRDGHTRCYVCHAESNNAFRLERLPPGAATWTEEQSRRNFEMAAILVNPGDPATSRLLLHKKVHDRFLRRLVDAAEGLRLGDGRAD